MNNFEYYRKNIITDISKHYDILHIIIYIISYTYRPFNNLLKYSLLSSLYIIISINLLSEHLSAEHQYPYDWGNLQSNNGWEEVSRTDRVTVYKKYLKASPLPALRAELISSVNLQKLIKAAWLVEESVQIFPNAYIDSAGVYLKTSDSSYTAFQIIDIPFMSPRLYQFNSIQTENSIHWANALNLNHNPKNMLIPPVNFGSWEIINLGKKSKIIYRICTDPGGDVPLWIVNLANQKYLPLILLDLENYAERFIEN